MDALAGLGGAGVGRQEEESHRKCYKHCICVSYVGQKNVLPGSFPGGLVMVD